MTPEEQWTAVSALAHWSDWAPFGDVALDAPKLPGVYLFRDSATHEIVYVGMAGERAGSGAAKGLWGRLGVYRIGKGTASGFGEAVFDRALASEEFLSRQLDRARAGQPLRSKEWAIESIAWWNPDVCWSTCDSKVDALSLEVAALRSLEGSALWNRGRSRSRRSSQF